MAVNFLDLDTFPANSANVSKATWREYNEEILNRIGNTPGALGSYAGQPMIAASGGMVPAGLASGALNFNGMQLWQGVPMIVPVAGSLNLNDDEHRGALLLCSSSSQIDLTLAANSNPAVGTSSPFMCVILRTGSGAVRIVGSGVTILNPDGHTKLSTNGIAQLLRISTSAWLHGYTTA